MPPLIAALVSDLDPRLLERPVALNAAFLALFLAIAWSLYSLFCNLLRLPWSGSVPVPVPSPPSEEALLAVRTAQNAVKQHWRDVEADFDDHNYQNPGPVPESKETCRGARDEHHHDCETCDYLAEKLSTVDAATEAAIFALESGERVQAVQHAARLLDPILKPGNPHRSQHDFLRAVLTAAYPRTASSLWRRIGANLDALHPCDVPDVLRIAEGLEPRHPWPLEDPNNDTKDFSRLPPNPGLVAFDASLYRRLIDWHATVESTALQLLEAGDHRAAAALIRTAADAHPSCPSIRGFENSMFWEQRIDEIGEVGEAYDPRLKKLDLPRFARELEAIICDGVELANPSSPGAHQ